MDDNELAGLVRAVSNQHNPEERAVLLQRLKQALTQEELLAMLERPLSMETLTRSEVDVWLDTNVVKGEAQWNCPSCGAGLWSSPSMYAYERPEFTANFNESGIHLRRVGFEDIEAGAPIIECTCGKRVGVRSSGDE